MRKKSMINSPIIISPIKKAEIGLVPCQAITSVRILVNTKKTDQLVTNILAPTRRMYDNDAKTAEVLTELF